VIVVVVEGQAELLEIVAAAGRAGALARRLDGRQEEADERADDGDDDEQFDEREPRRSPRLGRKASHGQESSGRFQSGGARQLSPRHLTLPER
jgi:hypothetical protein